MDIEILYITLMTLFVMLLIFIYGVIRCKKVLKDPLLNYVPGTKIDGWSMSHFLLYAFLSYLFPTKWVYLFGAGAAWETFEYISELNPELTEGIGNCSTGETWWFGQWSDILMNSLGIATGKLLHHYIHR
jgi:hypothetical protein